MSSPKTKLIVLFQKINLEDQSIKKAILGQYLKTYHLMKSMHIYPKTKIMKFQLMKLKIVC